MITVHGLILRASHNSKSQTGYVFMLNGGTISWRSRKQSVVTQSLMESEYITACEASNEAHWLKKFVIEIGVFHSCTDPVGIFCDNTGAIANAREPRTHSTTKHILRCFHVTRDYIRNGHTRLHKINMDLNVADPMTKPLPQSKFEEHQETIGVRYMHDVN